MADAGRDALIAYDSSDAATLAATTAASASPSQSVLTPASTLTLTSTSPSEYQPPLGQTQTLTPLHNPIPDIEQFYEILRALDPVRNTPKEFINLLVYPAVREQEVAQALCQIDHDRRSNPHAWRPPPDLVSDASSENP
ncbi:hypothetical protein F5B18DRAFT_656665 [Nemania serpens]|nr:hypothetical protein F5B18DRAFT_656665 [Nemania serpens]